MFQIVDIIQVSRGFAQRYPGSLQEGLWIVLDPEQTGHTPVPVQGQVVTISRPDGSSLEAELQGAERLQGAARFRAVLALHFRSLRRGVVPMQSTVAW